MSTPGIPSPYDKDVPWIMAGLAMSIATPEFRESADQRGFAIHATPDMPEIRADLEYRLKREWDTIAIANALRFTVLPGSVVLPNGSAVPRWHLRLRARFEQHLASTSKHAISISDRHRDGVLLDAAALERKIRASYWRQHAEGWR